MPQQNFITKFKDKRRCTRYKPRDAGTDTADRGQGKFAFHDAINTREFATNSCVTRKDTAGCRRGRFATHLAKNPHKLAENSHCLDTAHRGCSRFRFYGEKNTRGPATNLPVTETDIAHANRGQKHRILIQTRKSWEQIPQIANAAESHFTMQYTRGNNSRELQLEITNARTDRGQKHGNLLQTRERTPQIANAADSDFTMQYTRRNNSRVTGADITRTGAADHAVDAQFPPDIASCPTGIGAMFQIFMLEIFSQKNGMGDLSGEGVLTRFNSTHSARGRHCPTPVRIKSRERRSPEEISPSEASDARACAGAPAEYFMQTCIVREIGSVYRKSLRSARLTKLAGLSPKSPRNSTFWHRLFDTVHHFAEQARHIGQVREVSDAGESVPATLR
ncbi:hypothetical protein ISCGN_023229 [Ixodes scapularis]